MGCLSINCSRYTQGSPRVLRGGSGALIMLSVIAVCVGYQVWNSAIRQGRAGQSLGKSFAGTKLVDECSGRPLGPGRAFGRLLAHFLDSLLCYLGWLLPLVDRRRQTIADKLADSVSPRPRRRLTGGAAAATTQPAVAA